MHALPKVTMIVDLQYGSTGKGAIAGYLSMHEQFDTVISANMPNAGHTAYDNAGNKFVHKALPSGIFSDTIKRAMIGPGAVFDVEVLEREVRNAIRCGWLIGAEVLVHAMSVPLTNDMVFDEQSSPVTGIASTAQGSMIAQIEKMKRDPSACVVARDSYAPAPDLPIRVISASEWMDVITTQASNVLAEGAQGFSLGINQDFYPYCTSRECTPSRFLSDMALPHRSLVRVVGSARTFPIRVGNTSKGHSGACYHDQQETSWEELGVAPEMTTVTGRVRRVFTFSHQQFKDALLMTGADEVFMNFMNYIDPAMQEAYLMSFRNVAQEFGASVRYLGFGPKPTDIIEV